MTATTLRHYMNIVEAALLEAQNYGDMFNDVRRLDPDDAYAVFKITGIVRRASEVLKKKDRVVWFLRLWKVNFIGDLIALDRKPPLPEAVRVTLAALRDKLVADYARRCGTPVEKVIDSAKHFAWDGDLLNQFQHYLSLPIPSIQERVFDFDPPRSILAEFQAAEDAWRDKAKELIPHDPDDDARLITFPDGLFWQVLDRPSCDAEGKAMGHCGNAAGWQYGDRILSLRRDVRQGGKTHVRPSLTFILHAGGTLGEMKGRGNQKPNARYHPHIVALLRHPVVKGIVGGGYKPENNFSLADLPKDEQQALVAEKPALLGEPVYEQDGLVVFESSNGNAVTFHLAHQGKLVGHLDWNRDEWGEDSFRANYPKELVTPLTAFMREYFSEQDTDFWRSVPIDLNPYWNDVYRLRDQAYAWDRKSIYDLRDILQEIEDAAQHLPEPERAWDIVDMSNFPSYELPFGMTGSILAVDEDGDVLWWEGFGVQRLSSWIMQDGDDDTVTAYHLWIKGQDATEENIKQIADEQGIDMDEIDPENVESLLADHVAEFGDRKEA